MVKEIVIIRHSLTEGNIRNWYYGSTDLPLDELGIERIEQLKKEGYYPIVNENTLFFTSGLRRTKETLKRIYGEENSIIIPELEEIHFGKFECQTLTELLKYPDFVKWREDKTGHVALEGGDPAISFRTRVKNGINKVIDTVEYGEQGVLVVHGGVIAALMGYLFPEETENIWDWMPEPGYGHIIRIGKDLSISHEEIGGIL